MFRGSLFHNRHLFHRMQGQMTMDVAMEKEENLKIADLALLHVITPSPCEIAIRNSDHEK